MYIEVNEKNCSARDTESNRGEVKHIRSML